MKLLPAYGRVIWRGFRLNRRTVAMLKWAEKRSGVPISLAQGSYNAGGVAASGGTHDGGGSVDVRCKHLTSTQHKRLVAALKDAGFAAWHRAAVPNLWGEHCHCVAVGDKDLSSQAAYQVAAFDKALDGLRSARRDPSYRPAPKVRWSYLLGKPVKR